VAELNPQAYLAKNSRLLPQELQVVSLVLELLWVARLIRLALMPPLILLQLDYLAKTKIPQNNQVPHQACLVKILELPRAPAVEDLEWVVECLDRSKTKRKKICSVEVKIHRSLQALALPLQSLMPPLLKIRPVAFLVRKIPRQPLLSNPIRSLSCRLHRSKTMQEVTRAPNLISLEERRLLHRSRRSVGLR
jgi:hypothetical protein